MPAERTAEWPDLKPLFVGMKPPPCPPHGWARGGPHYWTRRCRAHPPLTGPGSNLGDRATNSRFFFFPPPPSSPPRAKGCQGHTGVLLRAKPGAAAMCCKGSLQAGSQASRQSGRRPVRGASRLSNHEAPTPTRVPPPPRGLLCPPELSAPPYILRTTV